MNRVTVKEEVVGSWLEVIQMANAAVMLGLGVKLENETALGSSEYRLEIFNEPRKKSVREVSYEVPSPSEDVDMSGLTGKSPMGYL